MFSAPDGYLVLGSDLPHQHLRAPCSEVKPAATASCDRYFFQPPMAERSERSERAIPVTTRPPFLTFLTYLALVPPKKAAG